MSTTWLQIVGGYMAEGYREAPPVSIAQESAVAWDAVPNGGSVAIYARVSLDGGNSWSGWERVAYSGAPVRTTIGVNLNNARLQLRQVLTASADLQQTPILQAVRVYQRQYNAGVQISSGELGVGGNVRIVSSGLQVYEGGTLRCSLGRLGSNLVGLQGDAVYLISPNGTRWRLSVTDGGQLTVTQA
jgi:hypothetical protein